MIINLGAPYRRYAAEGANSAEFAGGSHIVGERTHPFLIEQLGAIEHVAIRFRPGGLYAFARLSMHELTNRLVDAEMVLGTDRRVIEDRLSQCRTDQSRVAILDGLLLRRLRVIDTRAELAREALRLVNLHGGLLTVRDLCALVDCEYKELERSFLAVVGVGPKFFLRLARFRSAFDSLNAGSRGSLAERAVEFGYYDQAHFTKDFRHFVGVAPTRFVPRATSITRMLTSAPETAREVSNSYKTG